MNHLTIWRYLTTEKFEQLINDKGIYFSKASDFEDKREGYYTQDKYFENLRRNESDEDTLNAINSAEEMSNRIRDRSPSHNYISCWHKNNNENINMWNDYIKNADEGVVIKSNDIKIIWMIPHSLSEVITHYDCIYGDKNNNNDFTDNFKYKDQKFHSENEFRLVIDNFTLNVLTPFSGGLESIPCIGGERSYKDLGNGKDPKNDIYKKGNGFVVKYDLNKIIDEIRTHPKSSDKYFRHIKEKMKEAGLACPLNQSELK
ncbi:hypothetical protein [Pectobacterium aroidearum]|uniref:hypothetical protein n=1 Tax=Pectobacterium aroidearum TaxID=1201031 RepID=UPI0032EC68D0